MPGIQMKAAVGIVFDKKGLTTCWTGASSPQRDVVISVLLKTDLPKNIAPKKLTKEKICELGTLYAIQVDEKKQTLITRCLLCNKSSNTNKKPQGFQITLPQNASIWLPAIDKGRLVDDKVTKCDKRNFFSKYEQVIETYSRETPFIIQDLETGEPRTLENATDSSMLKVKLSYEMTEELGLSGAAEKAITVLSEKLQPQDSSTNLVESQGPEVDTEEDLPQTQCPDLTELPEPMQQESLDKSRTTQATDTKEEQPETLRTDFTELTEPMQQESLDKSETTQATDTKEEQPETPRTDLTELTESMQQESLDKSGTTQATDTESDPPQTQRPDSEPVAPPQTSSKSYGIPLALGLSLLAVGAILYRHRAGVQAGWNQLFQPRVDQAQAWLGQNYHNFINRA